MIIINRLPGLAASAVALLLLASLVPDSAAAGRMLEPEVPSDKDPKRYGDLVLASDDFVAHGDIRTPAVVNVRLNGGHFKLPDITAICSRGVASSDAGTDPGEEPVNACAGMDFFVRMTPGLERHIVLYLVKDPTSLAQFLDANNEPKTGDGAMRKMHNGWAAVNGHGIAKRCGSWTLDECFVSREMTYTSSYQDTAPARDAGPLRIIPPATPPPAPPTSPSNTTAALAGNSNTNNTTSTEELLTPADIQQYFPKPYEIISALPDGVGFDSRLAGSVYHVDLNAQHLLIEVAVPLEMAGHAFLQIEARPTGVSSTTVGLLGVLLTGALLASIGIGMLSVKRRALATHFVLEALTPRDVWTIGGRAGGAVGAAVAPQLQLPDIVGKPPTPARLDPELRRKLRHEKRQPKAAQEGERDGQKQEAEQQPAESNPEQKDQTEPPHDDEHAAAAAADERPLPAATSAPQQSNAAEGATPPADDACSVDVGSCDEGDAAEAAPFAAATPPHAVVRPPANSAGEAESEDDDENGNAPRPEGPVQMSWAALAAAIRDRLPNPVSVARASAQRRHRGRELIAADEELPEAAGDATTSSPASSAAPPSAKPGHVAAPRPPGTVFVHIPSSSSSSAAGSGSDDADELLCRICQDISPRGELFAPCSCAGTSKYVHRTCLAQWRLSTTNPQHREACAECKKRYVTRAEAEAAERAQREQELRQKAAAQRQAGGLAACAVPAWLRFVVLTALRPVYAVLGVILLGGYLVKLGAFVITGFDTGVRWLPDVYHAFLGVALVISELMVVSNLCYFFGGIDMRVTRGVLWTLGYVLPFAFGYVAIFFVWIAEVTLLKPEVAFVSGVACQFVIAQYFLPSLQEAAARLELRRWQEYHNTTPEQEAEALRNALRQTLEAANRQQQQPAGNGEGPAEGQRDGSGDDAWRQRLQEFHRARQAARDTGAAAEPPSGSPAAASTPSTASGGGSSSTSTTSSATGSGQEAGDAMPASGAA